MVEKMAKQKNVVRMCPQCNSTDISADFSSPGLVATGLFNSSFRCNNCGYAGNFFPVADKNNISPVKNKAEIKKRELINSSMYTNINRYYKYTGPVLILFSLLVTILSKGLFHKIGLFIYLPQSIIVTIIGFKKDWLAKHKYLRRTLLAIISLTIVLTLIFAMYYSRNPELLPF